ncbi:DHA2 family efflux MFS transporter permease subunit [Paenibacillus macquariensis]|uniref:Drug resistance transporter, EmrB/QacA subfamily n=1 Tax=Paenibacillus macquariensis TaxID=948756 RepID=A0ABY1KBN5_9BACL|nr:DHA2 family efflux MFS transporter permease subunit [Paenibacillus macquariensis]MEC0093559.1 DHA2 family efflux MFS transporter permease subunit [Paenibacillus macquariensis]OAB29834.1 MFS transporter [Paenibacillus macquariensis subsp. macquariensis]SIR56498.1 drug resistance transporter, EmrB/QacA subfamily [Paenibacillus macquariensis]
MNLDNIKKGPIVVALMIGAFVAFLNQTLLNVALPSIMNDLKIDATTGQWLTTGYMLVNGVLIPVTAYLISRFTTRQLFISAMSLFTIGTLICGLSPNFGILMVGRVIQASGAGIIMPLMMVVFLNIFPIEKRGAAMGLMGMSMILAPAIGPTLSGWIVENYDWRVLFYIILPFSAISTLIGVFFLKNVTKVTKPKFDMLSIVLSTIGFGGLLYGFSDAGTDGWGSTMVLSCLVVGTLSLILFVWRQMTSKSPMLEFRIFKYKMFTLTTIINCLITISMYAGMILLPIFLQNIRQFTPMESGIMMLPGAILMGIMSPITGKIFDKVGARWLSVIGLLITVVTTFEFTRLTDATTYTHMILIYTIRMFGMSLMMMPIQTAGLNQLPQSMNAHGTAMSNTLRTIAGSIGTAILVTVMTTQTKSHATDLAVAGGVSPSDKEAMAHIVTESTIHGINQAFLIATSLAVVALVLAFFIKKTKPAIEISADEVKQMKGELKQAQ